MNSLRVGIFALLIILGGQLVAEEIKIYKGDSTSWSNIIFTFNEGKLYRGDSTSWSNIVLTFSDELRTGELLGLTFLLFQGECM